MLLSLVLFGNDDDVGVVVVVSAVVFRIRIVISVLMVFVLSNLQFVVSAYMFICGCGMITSV